MISKGHRRLCVLALAVVMLLSVCLTGCWHEEPEHELTPPNDMTWPTTDTATISHDATNASEPDTTEAVVDPTVSEIPDESSAVETTVPAETVVPTDSTEDIMSSETVEPVSGESETVNSLSDDPFSYQISIDGTVIQLPCNVSVLTDLGWIMDDKKVDNTLDENYTTGVNVYNGGCFMTLSIYNDGDSAVKFTDAMVDDISIHESSVEGHEIFICGGLTIGSTKDDVKAVYGDEPTRAYSDETSFSSLTYEGHSYRYRIEFTFKDDIVTGIDVCAG